MMMNNGINFKSRLYFHLAWSLLQPLLWSLLWLLCSLLWLLWSLFWWSGRRRTCQSCFGWVATLAGRRPTNQLTQGVRRRIVHAHVNNLRYDLMTDLSSDMWVNRSPGWAKLRSTVSGRKRWRCQDNHDDEDLMKMTMMMMKRIMKIKMMTIFKWRGSDEKLMVTWRLTVHWHLGHHSNNNRASRLCSWKISACFLLAFVHDQQLLDSCCTDYVYEKGVRDAWCCQFNSLELYGDQWP